MLKKKFILIIFSALIILALFLFFSKKEEGVDSILNGIGEENSVEVTVDTGLEDIDIVEIGSEESRQKPDLSRKINFSKSYPEEAKNIILAKVAEIITVLNENPESFDNWLELGLYRKMAEDYIGTEEVWQYAAYLEPDRFVVWGNLADLYSLYLKDNINAEKHYLLALRKGPQQDYLYFKTVNFYIDFLNNEDKALEIAKKGVENKPNSEKLNNLLVSLEN